MIPFSFKVTIPPKTIAYLKKLGDAPKKTPRAIQRGLDSALDTIKDNLIKRRLTGQGPFPPSQHRLGSRTGALQASVYTRSVIQGNKVIGEIGSTSIYAPVHEYGAVIRARNAPYLVFRVLGGQWVRTKQVVEPERAPFRTEMEMARSTQAISGEVAGEIEDLLSE